MIKTIITICFIGLTISVSAQSNSNDEVKKTIETFFEGFHKGDTILMKSVMMEYRNFVLKALSTF